MQTLIYARLRGVTIKRRLPYIFVKSSRVFILQMPNHKTKAQIMIWPKKKVGLRSSLQSHKLWVRIKCTEWQVFRTSWSGPPPSLPILLPRYSRLRRNRAASHPADTQQNLHSDICGIKNSNNKLETRSELLHRHTRHFITSRDSVWSCVQMLHSMCQPTPYLFSTPRKYVFDVTSWLAFVAMAM